MEQIREISITQVPSFYNENEWELEQDILTIYSDRYIWKMKQGTDKWEPAIWSVRCVSSHPFTFASDPRQVKYPSIWQPPFCLLWLIYPIILTSAALRKFTATMLEGWPSWVKHSLRWLPTVPCATLFAQHCSFCIITPCLKSVAIFLIAADRS